MDLAKLLKSIKTSAPTATNAGKGEETVQTEGNQRRPDGAKPSLLSSSSSSFSTSSESGSDDDEGNVERRTSNPNRPSGSRAVRSGGIIGGAGAGGARASNALLNPRNAMRLYDATATAAEAETDHGGKGGEEATATTAGANGSSVHHVHAGELALMPGARRRVGIASINGNKLVVGMGSGGPSTSIGGKGGTSTASSALKNKLFIGLGSSVANANSVGANTSTKVELANSQAANASGAAAVGGLAALFQRKRVDDASAKAALEAAKAKLEAARASSLIGTKRPRGEDDAMHGGEFDPSSSSTPLNSTATDNAMTVFNDDFVDLETIGIAHRGAASSTTSSSGVANATTVTSSVAGPLNNSNSSLRVEAQPGSAHTVPPSSSHPSSVSASLAAATLTPVAPLLAPQMVTSPPNLLPPEGEDLSWDDF